MNSSTLRDEDHFAHRTYPILPSGKSIGIIAMPAGAAPLPYIMGYKKFHVSLRKKIGGPSFKLKLLIFSTDDKLNKK